MAHEASTPLTRAREIAFELTMLVARTRERAAELEAERDQLRLELSRALTRPPRPESPVTAPGAGSRTRARSGDLREALAPAFDAPARRSANVVALLGGRSEAGL